MLNRNMQQEVFVSPPINLEQPCVLVLAAGRGERFLASGGSTHKLQAMLGPQTVLQTTLAAVQASGLPWHVEYGPHPGMGDSIAAAVKLSKPNKAIKRLSERLFFQCNTAPPQPKSAARIGAPERESPSKPITPASAGMVRE